MKAKKIIHLRGKSFITILVLVFLTFNLNAQNTLIETSEEEQIFKTSMELLVREKYASARKSFEYYLQKASQSNNTENLRFADAQYYVAYCALQLFNPDAEYLFIRFLDNYSWHSKASLAYFELGNFFYNTKKYQKTIDYLQKVDVNKLSKDLQNEMQFKLGYAYFSQKEFEKASPLFDRIKLGSHKYTYAARYYAGYLELKDGRYDEAIEDLMEAEKNEAYASVVPYLLANVYYQKGDYDKLIPYSEAALNRKEIQEKQELYMLLAESHFKKENYPKAAEFFENFQKSSKSKLSEPVRYRLAYSQYMTGKFEQAVENFKPLASSKDALGQASSYYLALSFLKTGNKQYALLAFQQASKSDFSKQIQEEALFNYAKVNAELENFNEAITALKQFNRAFPKSQHSQEGDELLGEAFLKTSNYTEAINYIESLNSRSLRLNTAYQRVTFYKGIEEFNNKNFARAVEMFSKSSEFTFDKDIYLGASFWKGEAYSIMRDYNNAISSYSKVFQNSNSSNDYHLKSRYGIGYAYYNTQKFDKALEHFREYSKKLENTKNRMFFDDAVLRVGDLYAYNKSYDEALAYYDKAIETRNPDLDYAQYKKGVVLAFQEKTQPAIESFDKVINFYPNSLYLDDALYGKAELVFTQGEFVRAIELFTKVVSEHSNSPYIPYALNFRAISYVNEGKYTEAIEDYKRILTEFGQHEVSVEALSGIQDALNKTDRSEEFDEYRKIFVQNNPDTKSLVNIDYEAARSLYNNQKYQKAIDAFTSYIQKYPESPNNPDARYFLAESYLKADQNENAITQFKSVIEDRKTDYYTRAILRLADIYYNQNDFGAAKNYYHLLLSNSNNPKERSIAWASLMETYYKLEQLDSAEHYASQILQHSKFAMDANKASLYQGKVAYKKGEFDKAIDYFITTINLAKDENAAEAKYMIARVQYDQKKFNESLETLYELNKLYYSYDKWLGKSFLLIADNFIALEEIFQAKATLQSIIDKSTHKESVEEAKKKLTSLENNAGKEGGTNE